MPGSRYDRAIDGYRQALQRAPHRIDLLVGFGWLYLAIAAPRRAAPRS